MPRQKASSRRNVAEPRQGTKTATGLFAAARSSRLQRGSIARRERIADRSRRRAEARARSPAHCATAARRAARRRSCCRCTCIVYCEAPMTVARMRVVRPRQCAGPPSAALRISAASSGPRSPKRLARAAIDIFGDAAGKADIRRFRRDRRADRDAADRRRRRAGEPPSIASNRRSAMRRQARAPAPRERDRPARASGQAPRRSAGRLPRAARCAAPHRARPAARRHRARSRRRPCPSAQTAILAVPPPTSTLMHRRLVADRARHRARAIGGHGGFQAVAGADRDELAGLRARTIRRWRAHCGGAPRRRSGSARRCRSRRARVGVLVLLRDEGAERVGVDRLFAGIGREQDVGLIEASRAR